MVHHPLHFDRIARPYRWLEYLTLGRSLEQCRFAHLPALIHARRALILGDGDGRFLSKLLQANTDVSADVVDLSATMLLLSESRVARLHRLADVSFHQADLREPLPDFSLKKYDLVATHFVLDCLCEAQIAALVADITPRLTANARWIISEFTIPSSRPGKILAHSIVTFLYFAFRILTGLRVQRLPDHRRLLTAAGLHCQSVRLYLGGVLCSELWHMADAQLPGNSDAPL